MAKIKGGPLWTALVVVSMPFMIGLCVVHLTLRWLGYYEDDATYY